MRSSSKVWGPALSDLPVHVLVPLGVQVQTWSDVIGMQGEQCLYRPLSVSVMNDMVKGHRSENQFYIINIVSFFSVYGSGFNGFMFMALFFAFMVGFYINAPFNLIWHFTYPPPPSPDD